MHRTTEANYEACRQRCKLTVYCFSEDNQPSHESPPAHRNFRGEALSEATSLLTGLMAAVTLLVVMLIGCQQRTTKSFQDRARIFLRGQTDP